MALSKGAPGSYVAATVAVAFGTAGATGVAVAALGPIPLLASLGGVLLVALSFVRPDIGLASLLFIVAILPPAPTTIGPGEISFGLVVGASVAGWVSNRGRNRTLERIEWLVLILLALMVLSAAWGIGGGTAADQWFRGVVPYLGLLLILPARDYFTPGRGHHILLIGLYGSGLIAAFITFQSGGAGLALAIDAGNALAIRSEISPTAYQVSLLAPLAFAIGAALTGRTLRWLHILMLLTLSAAASLTLLRSLVLLLAALLVIALFVLIRHRRHGVLLFGLGGSALVLIVASTAGLFTRTSAAGLLIAGYVDRFGRSSESTRLSELAAVGSAFLDSPLFGHGMGYQYAYFRPSLGEMWGGGYTHNIITYFLLTLGVIGMLVLGPLIFLAMRRAWSIAHWYVGPRRDLAAGLAFVVFAVLGYAMFQSTFRTLGFSLVFALAVGSLGAFQRGSERAIGTVPEVGPTRFSAPTPAPSPVRPSS